MFGSKEYANAGFGSDESMGFLGSDDGGGGILDFALNLASGLVPGVATPLPAAAPIVFAGSSPAQVLTDGATRAARVTAPSGVKLRAAPSEVTGAVIMGLVTGTVVSVLSTDYPPTAAAPKGWAKVRTEDGKEGFVTTEWLSISSPTSASSGGGSSSSSSSLVSVTPNVTPTPDGGGFFDNKLLLIGGGVVALVVAGALVFGGKKKGRK